MASFCRIVDASVLDWAAESGFGSVRATWHCLLYFDEGIRVASDFASLGIIFGAIVASIFDEFLDTLHFLLHVVTQTFFHICANPLQVRSSGY